MPTQLYTPVWVGLPVTSWEKLRLAFQPLFCRVITGKGAASVQAQYLLIMSENQSGCRHGKTGHDGPTGVYTDLVSRGRKSRVLFKLGKRQAEALMTSVGFGVTRPRTCCFK